MTSFDVGISAESGRNEEQRGSRPFRVEALGSSEQVQGPAARCTRCGCTIGNFDALACGMLLAGPKVRSHWFTLADEHGWHAPLFVDVQKTAPCTISPLVATVCACKYPTRSESAGWKNLEVLVVQGRVGASWT